MVRVPDPITSNDGLLEGVYGDPPATLARLATEARRFTPLDPSGEDLAEAPDALLDRLVVLAPPGTLERQGVIAHGLRVLKPGGKLIALARKDLGGMRLSAELTRLGCRVVERSKAHHRICACPRPVALDRLEPAIAQAAPRFIPQIGLWTQPGLFSWDRIDAGSALLLERLSDCKGRGADLGCGIGVVSRALLESSGVTQLLLIDIDRRAIAMAKRNIDDPRAVFLHADALQPKVLPQDLDFVAINPPRRVGGTADRSLALDLLFAAIRALRPGGRLLTVVERTLACESAIQARVSLLRPATREGGYKLLEAVK